MTGRAEEGLDEIQIKAKPLKGGDAKSPV